VGRIRYTFDAVKLNPQNITTVERDEDYQPMMSADGRRIIFVRREQVVTQEERQRMAEALANIPTEDNDDEDSDSDKGGETAEGELGVDRQHPDAGGYGEGDDVPVSAI